MKYYHCKKCGYDSSSKSGMMQHSFDEIIVIKETISTQPSHSTGVLK